jgi:Fe-S cluster biogenesis protein NfuA
MALDLARWNPCPRGDRRDPPALQSDGGDIVFNGIDEDGVVHVSLVGACGTCPVSTMTLKAGVERIIMDRVPGVTEVVADE